MCRRQFSIDCFFSSNRFSPADVLKNLNLSYIDIAITLFIIFIIPGILISSCQPAPIIFSHHVENIAVPGIGIIHRHSNQCSSLCMPVDINIELMIIVDIPIDHYFPTDFKNNQDLLVGEFLSRCDGKTRGGEEAVILMQIKLNLGS